MKKTCIKCGKEKDITEFYKNFSNKDCYSNICKECQLKANKEWIKNNKERKRELSKNYYQRKKAIFNQEIKNEKPETITFYIEQDLKKDFQIKLIEDESSITEKLTELIRKYIGE